MPPKKLTPYQFSNSLTFEKQIPDFLKHLVQERDANTPNINSKFADEDHEFEKHEDETNLKDDEKPQVVVLKEGDITAEEFEKLKEDGVDVDDDKGMMTFSDNSRDAVNNKCVKITIQHRARNSANQRKEKVKPRAS
jgi:GTPase involved in cell partitioning and DNA repair